MLSAAFVGGLLKHFGDGRQRLAVLGDLADPEAMCVLHPRGGGLWSTFLPSQAQVGPLLIGARESIAAMIGALPGYAVGLDLLCVDPDLLDLGAVTGRRESTQHALTMNVRLDRGFDAYWAERPSGLRQNLRRYERRAVADGLQPRYEQINEAQAIVDAVTRYANLESQGWKGAKGTALSPQNDQGRFYMELMHVLASQKCAVVHELWMGDRLAASRLVIISGGMLVMLKTTYDETLDKYAPGRLLLRHVLETCFSEHPGKVVEFYTDATQDQLAWATGQRPICHWTFYRSPTAERAVATLRIARHLLLPRLGSAAQRPLVAELCDSVAALPADAVRLLDSAEHTSIQFGADWFRAMTAAVFKGANIRFCLVR
jgi:hypothetical protein